jgi:hypothetical protein
MRDPNTYTPDWVVDTDPEQADDYDSTDDSSSTDSDQADDEGE